MEKHPPPPVPGSDDEQAGAVKCSFCGKSPFDTDGAWVKGMRAIICPSCIATYHRELHKTDGAGR